MNSFIEVRHNIEVAHRLMNLPGKCQQIHGHSMMVRLNIDGNLNANGILEGLDFSDVKKRFRAYLDTTYDHHLVLNENDPWAKVLQDVDQHNAADTLPGLVTVPGDPTVEHLSKWIAEWATKEFKIPYIAVMITETATNGAGYMSFDEEQ